MNVTSNNSFETVIQDNIYEGMNKTETVHNDQGFVVGIYSALFVVGAAGNVCVFVSLVRSRRRKSRVNLLMTHLAVADLIVTFIVIPFEVCKINFNKK